MALFGRQCDGAIIPEDRLLLTLGEYLEFVVPGQSNALVQEVRTFLAQKQAVGGILLTCESAIRMRMSKGISDNSV
jgi:hypothetical protein